MKPEAVVHLVDDDPAIREGLGALLTVEGYDVRLYESGEAALASLSADSTGCVVADVRMPGISGLELLQSLRRRGINLPLIIITGHGDVPMAVSALKAGARDFIEKPFDSPVILAAIAEVIAGAAQTLPGTEAEDPELEALELRFRLLTPRESEVMDLVVQGHPNKVVAHRLGIAVRTVEIHRAHVMEKTGARNLSQLVRMALRLQRGG